MEVHADLGVCVRVAAPGSAELRRRLLGVVEVGRVDEVPVLTSGGGFVQDDRLPPTAPP